MNSDRTRPRVAVMSLRNFENHVSRSCGYEFEDVICEQLDFARLIAPASPGRFPIGRSLRNWVTRRVGNDQATRALNPGAEKTRLDADYDLFFFSAARLRDLLDLDTVPDWRARSRFAVCWLQELWNNDITDDNKLLDLLNRFDHVICSFEHSIEPLAKRISVPVSYLPWSVDTQLFCPFPEPPRRVIDVAAVGVVPPDADKALRCYADDTGGYFYRTTVHGMPFIQDHRGHRENYAGLLKRSKYFLSFAAKFMATEERGAQVEFGLRYIEGVAAGTVLLGNRIDNDAFRDYLGWEDSVVELSIDDPSPDRLIRRLEADPERVAAARRANLINALTRLDHLHRWQDVLAIADMLETPAMIQRRKRLSDLADMVRKADDQVLVPPQPAEDEVAQSSA